MKLSRLPALAAVLVLAGCSASPTDSPLRDQPSARFNEGAAEGGNMLGSGNYAGDGMNQGESAPVPGDTVTRGPGMLGSGN